MIHDLVDALHPQLLWFLIGGTGFFIVYILLLVTDNRELLLLLQHGISGNSCH